MSGFGLGIARWDAAPHFVDGVERSLDGGLRYSIQGGSYEAYRDLLQWEGTPPTTAEFQSAVEQAFAAWEVIDPATGLETNLRFVPDFDTPAVGGLDPENPDDIFRLNPGAELDLLVADFSAVENRTNIDVFGDPAASTVTLTSGVADYPAAVISGADLLFDDTGYLWTINGFRDDLIASIGIALGVSLVDRPADVDEGGFISHFYDDNYDNTSSATALATLTNSFANLIDPFDPDNSPALSLFEVCAPTEDSICFGDPGIDSRGVDILMELDVLPGEMFQSELQNDDLAARQFLYPYTTRPIPEPSTLLLACASLVGLIHTRRRGSSG